MDRPVIGLCSALERARWSVWDQPAALLPRNYIDAVQLAGGMALLLPPDPRLIEQPDELLGMLDGLLLAGGADIDPATYGQRPHPAAQEAVPERDAFEIALTRGAIERDIPVLGICRGMQLINVALGGTLIQHLPEHLGHEEHCKVTGSFEGSDHQVEVLAGTLAMRVIGEARHDTKSHHHQGVDRLGEGLQVSAVAHADGLIEALELPERGFVLGVQWHPEADSSSPVIAGLLQAAREHAHGRAVAT